MDHSITVEIPSESEKQASAIYRSLQPDPELKPHEFRKQSELKSTKSIAKFEGSTERTSRVGVNSFMDSLIEALECVSAFDPNYFQ